MSSGGAKIKRFLNEQANLRLGQLGYSDGRVRDAKREAWWWIDARARALRRGRGLLSGWAVVWTEPGRAECLAIEVPRPGSSEVTVSIEVSAVSPGTERAQYLRLPNARVGYPHRPGYSAAGVVLEVGADVRDVKAGDRVAVVGSTHASIATVPARSVLPLPPEVSLGEAALVQLGVICGQGVRRANLVRNEPLCVVGSGLVGLLAQRLAGSAGGGPVTVVARSTSKKEIALSAGAARFLTLESELAEIERLAAPVVIEATGDPDVLPLVAAAAAHGGRIVLLGSPRGVTRDLPVDLFRSKRLELVGAHVETLGFEARDGSDPRREEASHFLALLASGSVQVADIAGPLVDPREADMLYRQLTRRSDFLSARFDWSRLQAHRPPQRAGIARVPRLRARGVDVDHPLAARVGKRDHFDGAVGMLRIGLIGCGDIGFHNARAVAAAPNARLVACYDPTLALAADVARSYGAEVEPSLESLLDRGDVDAAFVAVPHHLHAPLAAQAAEAGKHVIIEKPLANNLTAALDLVSSVERAGVVLSVCFPHRYEPHVVAARELIAAGAIGELAGTLVNFFAEKPPSYWMGGFSGRSISTWRASRVQAGGGVLIMNLSHLLDLVRHLTGADVQLCTAVAQTTDAASEVEDTISASVRYENGAVGSLMGSAALRGHRGGRTDLHLWGDDGYLIVEPALKVFTGRLADEAVPTTRWQLLQREHGVDIRAIYVSRLASALARNQRPDVTAQDALAVQALIEAAYRSAQTGETVRPAELLADSTP